MSYDSEVRLTLAGIALVLGIGALASDPRPLLVCTARPYLNEAFDRKAELAKAVEKALREKAIRESSWYFRAGELIRNAESYAEENIYRTSTSTYPIGGYVHEVRYFDGGLMMLAAVENISTTAAAKSVSREVLPGNDGKKNHRQREAKDRNFDHKIDLLVEYTGITGCDSGKKKGVLVRYAEDLDYDGFFDRVAEYDSKRKVLREYRDLDKDGWLDPVQKGVSKSKIKEWQASAPEPSDWCLIE